MRIVQVFNGDKPILAESIPVEVDEDNMHRTVTFRVATGDSRTGIWSLDIEVGEWNGIPRIVRVTAEDLPNPRQDEES